MLNKIIAAVLTFSAFLALNFGAAFAFDADTRIADVINHPKLKTFGRLIFPVNNNYYSGDTLKNLRLTWYGRLNTSRTVDIVNYMLEHSDNVFYPIYPANDRRARNTGLFFFRGKPGAKFAICNAGGGFVLNC